MPRVGFTLAEIRCELGIKCNHNPRKYRIVILVTLSTFTPIVALTLFPQIVDSFRDAVAEFEHLNIRLEKYVSTVAIGEWDCTPVANELRYAGHHLCRSLMVMGKEKDIELLRAEGHCRKAVHDANDYLILFFGDAIRDAIREALSQCEGEYVTEIKKLRGKFLEICSSIAELDRTDKKNFSISRKRLINELEEIFLSVVKDCSSQNSVAAMSSALNEVTVSTQYDGGFSDEDVVKMFNETEKHLKMSELFRGRVNPSHIHGIFKATCCLVIGKDESQCRETFLRECCRVHVTILYHMLYFLAKETSSQIPMIWYERVVRGKIPYTDMKNYFLKDIEECIRLPEFTEK